MRGIRSSTVQLRRMRERTKTLNEALQLACQYQGMEESQKRLHGVSAKVERIAVGRERGCCITNAQGQIVRMWHP